MPCAIWSTPGAVAVRTVLSEAADAAINDAWVDRPHVIPGDVQPMLDRRTHIFDHDVCRLDQPHERGVAFGALQIEPNGALVAVQVLKVEAMPHADSVLGLCPGWLDADDVGAPVGQMSNAGGPSASEREIENSNIGEWQGPVRGRFDHEPVRSFVRRLGAGYVAAPPACAQPWASPTRACRARSTLCRRATEARVLGRCPGRSAHDPKRRAVAGWPSCALQPSSFWGRCGGPSLRWV